MVRRAFLGTAAAAAAAAATRSEAYAAPTVSVAYAGSLVAFMEKSLGPAFTVASGIGFAGQPKGSTALANLIRGGLLTPDVFVSADTASIESLFGAAGHESARWDATFAATRMQLAYSASSKHAALFADAAAGKRTWYEVLGTAGVLCARTDPAQDPKGYRVLLVCELAAKLYGKPTLSRDLLGDPENPAQILPEESAVARLESGDIDALWVYSVEAAGRGYATLELDPKIDLGSPAYAADYATASVTVGDKTYRGAPIVYALTIPSAAPDPAGAAAFVEFLVGPQGAAAARKAGLTPVKPVVAGNAAAVPAALASALAAVVPAGT